MKAPKVLLYIIMGNRGISDRLRAHKLSSYAQDVLTLGTNDYEHRFLYSLIGWETSISLISFYMVTKNKNICVKKRNEKVIYP